MQAEGEAKGQAEGQAAGQADGRKLSRSTLFYYSLVDMPVMMSIFPVIVFIPRFYASDMAVSLELIGTILFVQRLIDVLTDPLMGYISDRTKTRWGNRRPWVVASTPILMLSIYQLFFPPEGAGGMHLFVWMLMLSVGTTMMLIPYYAWGAELSTDYHERSRVTGWRAQAGVVGQLAAQLIPAVAGIVFLMEGTDVVLMLVGSTMLLIMPICTLLTVTKTPPTEVRVDTRVPIMEGLRIMWKNAAFVRLISAFTVASIGLNITTPLYAFFIAFVLGAEGKEIYMLSFFYLSNLLSIPLWVRFASRVGKHRAYLTSLIMIACAHPFYLLLGPGEFWWMLPITIATGISAGGFSSALPNSMKADVIDVDQLESGENRAAQFFATWSFAMKGAAALGGVIAMWVLAGVGFDAVKPENNGEAELFGLRFLFSTFPSIFFLVAAAIAWKYPITEARHAQVRAALAARL